MARYTATVARQHFSDLLDAAAQGEEIVIERRGVRFDLRVAPEPKPRVRQKPRIVIRDDRVAEGSWTWAWGPEGLKISTRHR